MDEINQLRRNWALVEKYTPNCHRMAKEHLIWIFLMIDTGWITPAIKPEIMAALEKLEKVDMDSEVIYNAD